MKKNVLSIKYLLGLLNSKLLNFYYDKYFNMGSDFTTAVSTENLDTLPIHNVDFSNNLEKKIYDEIEMKVDEMLSLNFALQEVGDKQTDATELMRKKIRKTDSEIDELVNSIYGLPKNQKNGNN